MKINIFNFNKFILGMVPSPSASLNTPLGAGAGSPQDEQAYREKVRQLSRYIDPLRKMIAKAESDGSKYILFR